MLGLDRQSFWGCMALRHKLQCMRYDFRVHEIHMKRVFYLSFLLRPPPPSTPAPPHPSLLPPP